MATKITIETCYNKCTVEVPEDDMCFGDIIDNLFVPAALGVGYMPGTIKDFIETDVLP